jgi:thiol-disulfide isomerase/thioredoxin
VNVSPGRRRLLVAAFAAAAAGPVRAAGPDAPARVGDRVDWTDVVLLDGRTLSAAELARAVVVVEFWASWCPFCKRQNPHLQALAERHRDGLLVLALSIDKEPAKARAYLQEHGYTFAAAMAPKDSVRWFGKRVGLPEVWVVDRGTIVHREPGEMFPEDVAALGRFARKAG